MSFRQGLVALACGMLLSPFMSVPDALAQCKPREPTRATGPGPHDYGRAADSTRLWHKGDPGEALFLRVRVMDTCGQPLAGARVQVLHANHEGAHEHDRWRGVTTTNARGAAQVLTVFPGYTGGLPRHIHFVVSHPQHAELVTRLFFKNDPEADIDVEDLAMVLEQVERDGARAWLAGYEFVLAKK